MSLLDKKREEMLVMGSIRVSYSWDDVLLEDFFEDKNHPYAIYDRRGNLLDTNLNYSEGCLPMWNLYSENINAINYIIEKFGVDI